jgi:heme/copper-type cytochrome/quinol oxidase subunit 2
MVQLINAIIFLLATVWMIVDRFKFEKSNESKDDSYIALYREHNTLQIVLFAVLCVYCFCNYFGI